MAPNNSDHGRSLPRNVRIMHIETALRDALIEEALNLISASFVLVVTRDKAPLTTIFQQKMKCEKTNSPLSEATSF